MTSVRHQVTFDFRDAPQLLDSLRLFAAKRNSTQKAILAKALRPYFAQCQDELALLMAAEKSFAEWDNEQDRVYNAL
ncbi:MAG TPA: hypothetical protein VJN43_23130 [Bryobacteraceae bacterium]|nr:hypothetical protein [Bryobacteraceae bacterium]